MNSITQETLNPLDMIPKLFKFDGVPDDMNYRLGHIEYDPKVNEEYDFRIIRESTHDGTMLFSMQLLGKVLEPVVKQTAYSSKDFTPEEIAEKVKEINYTIGDLTIENDFGVKNINDTKIHGQTEKAYLPVKCEYIYK